MINLLHITFLQIGDVLNNIGAEIFEDGIDEVIFATNSFLTNSNFIGQNGPFWYILEFSTALAATFAIITAAGMTYKSMVKGEPIDYLKVMRILGISIVMFFWYPPSMTDKGDNDACILDALAYIPNCLGSYTYDLYSIEAAQVQSNLDKIKPLIVHRDTLLFNTEGELKSSVLLGSQASSGAGEDLNLTTVGETTAKGKKLEKMTEYTGFIIAADKLIMLFALIIYRVGWWATIYCQQIMLGVLTIFGPIQWAFSVLPKWEGAWAKWLVRYLTVHLYGCMLYFVGFYVLLLFDITLSLQLETLESMGDDIGAYVQNAVITSGYLFAASLVALKCLSLVPDLASWIIPEGEAAFSARGFGEGVSSGMQSALRFH